MKIYVLAVSVLALSGLAACSAPYYHSGANAQRYDTGSHDARPDIHRVDNASRVHTSR